jgi:hypothetical protein
MPGSGRASGEGQTCGTVSRMAIVCIIRGLAERYTWGDIGGALRQAQSPCVAAWIPGVRRCEFLLSSASLGVTGSWLARNRFEMCLRCRGPRTRPGRRLRPVKYLDCERSSRLFCARPPLHRHKAPASPSRLRSVFSPRTPQDPCIMSWPPPHEDAQPLTNGGVFNDGPSELSYRRVLSP